MKNLEKLSDEDLMIFAKNGEKNKVVEILYKRHRGTLIGWANLFTSFNNPEESRDVVQDAFIKVYYGIQTYRKKGKVKNWLISIVKNLCIDYFRKNNARGKNLITKAHDIGFYEKFARQTTFQDADYGVRKENFYTLLNLQINKIPEKSREVIKERFYNELSNKEISEKLGVSVGIVKCSIHRGRNKLKKGLKNFSLN